MGLAGLNSGLQSESKPDGGILDFIWIWTPNCARPQGRYIAVAWILIADL